MASKRPAPPKPPADPSTSTGEEEDGSMSSSDSTSHRQKVADENPFSQREWEEEEEAEESAEEESAEEESAEEGDEDEEADLQPPSKSPGPAVPEEDEDADLQPSNPPVPVQPAAKSPARKRKRASDEVAKSPAREHQQGEKEAPKRKSTKHKSQQFRRTWAPDDEVQILVALADHRRQHGKLPDKRDILFFDSVAERLQDKGWKLRDIKGKVRSLERRYNSHAVSTTHHEKRLDDLSSDVWGDLPETVAANGTTTAGTENGGRQTQDKSFDQMCEVYPQLAHEVKLLAEVQPALKSCFNRLDDKRARSIEDKLEKVRWTELKIQVQMATKVDAPKAKIRKKLVNWFVEVSKDV